MGLDYKSGGEKVCHEAIICRSFKEVSIEKYWQREKGEAIRPRPPSLPRGLSNFVSLT